MEKVIIGSLLLGSMLFAGGDIAPTPVVEEAMAETKAWSFELEPYLMVTNIGGSTNLVLAQASELDVDFGTILDNLDAAAMIHAEAHHQSGWGFWVDYGFMDLSNSVDAAQRITSARARQGVLEVMGLYRQTLESGYVEYLAGIRWWDNDIDVGYNLPNLGRSGTVSKEVDWVDAVVGLRYTHILNENWKFRMHGDLGGSSNNFTVSTSAGVIYTINDLIDINVRYKATWVDYEEGTVFDIRNIPNNDLDYFAYDTVTHGLILGVNFKF